MGRRAETDAQAPAGEARVTRLVSSFLAVPLGVAGLLVAVRALVGRPIHSVVAIGAPLNPESAAAICLLLSLILLGRGPAASPTPQRARLRTLGALGLALVVTLACYWRSLWFPFISDDYVIVARSLRGEMFGPVLTQGDAGVAFRPLTRFLFAVQGRWGSADPVWWHSVGVIFHLANCALVFLLARRFVAPGVAVFAAAIFGLHATHPEAVSWMNSRSDVLAAFFLLSALLVFLEHWTRPHWGRQVAALLLVALAVLNKESAYAFAPLAWLLIAAKEKPGWKGIRVLRPFVALEGALFAYRWWVLGGIGGYASSATGRSVFLSFDLLRIVKTLCWRTWAILFFPVNWDVPATASLGVTLVLAAAALVLLSRARTERRTLLALAAFVVVSILPVLPLAMVGPSLLNARLYYLPSVGFGLLLGVALNAVRPVTLRAGAAAALLLFHFAALRQELDVWQSVTRLAKRTCVDTATLVSPGSSVAVSGLPDTINGVFFLGNGFQECVELEAGRRLPALVAGRGQPANSTGRVFRWDPDQRRLVAAGP